MADENKKNQQPKEEKASYKQKKPIKKNCLSNDSRDKLVAFIQK
jgi:hypothetical protein